MVGKGHVDVSVPGSSQDPTARRGVDGATVSGRHPCPVVSRSPQGPLRPVYVWDANPTAHRVPYVCSVDASAGVGTQVSVVVPGVLTDWFGVDPVRWESGSPGVQVVGPDLLLHRASRGVDGVVLRRSSGLPYRTLRSGWSEGGSPHRRECPCEVSKVRSPRRRPSTPTNGSSYFHGLRRFMFPSSLGGLQCDTMCVY